METGKAVERLRSSFFAQSHLLTAVQRVLEGYGGVLDGPRRLLDMELVSPHRPDAEPQGAGLAKDEVPAGPVWDLSVPISRARLFALLKAVVREPPPPPEAPLISELMVSGGRSGRLLLISRMSAGLLVVLRLVFDEFRLVSDARRPSLRCTGFRGLRYISSLEPSFCSLRTHLLYLDKQERDLAVGRAILSFVPLRCFAYDEELLRVLQGHNDAQLRHIARSVLPEAQGPP